MSDQEKTQILNNPDGKAAPDKYRKSFREWFRKARKKKRFWVFLILIALAIGGLVFYKVTRAKLTSAKATSSVQTATAKTGTLSSTVDGTGSLAVGTTSDIDVPIGIQIDKVLVSSGDTVTAGQTLATVNAASVANTLLTTEENIDTIQSEIDSLSSDADDSSTEEYLKKVVLEGELSDLQEEESILNNLNSTLAITASGDGTISAVNVSDNSEVSKSSTSTGTSSSGSSTSSSSTGSSSSTSSSGSSSASVTKTAFTKTSSVTALTSVTTITDLTSVLVTAPKAGETPQGSLAASSDSYTGSVSWDCDGAFCSGSTYTATILLTAKNGYAFASADNLLVRVQGATITSDTPKIIGGDNTEGNSVYIKAVFQTPADTTAAASQNEGNTSSGSSVSASESVQSSTSDSAASQTASSASGTTGSSSTGTTSGSSSTDNSSSTSSLSSYNNYTAAAFTIASGNDMSLSVSVDELDIASVKTGQAASVTLDAISNQTFTGTVSKIATSSSNTSSSGTAKYTVKITLPKSDGMMIGMSASATITISESANAIIIPVNALQEEGTSTFVYTQEDASGNLSGKTEVQTGLSNGTQVAITSGLKDGDTVYYYKTSSSDSSSSDMTGPQDMGGSGQMPSGGSGQAPSGSGSGQAPSAPSGSQGGSGNGSK